MTPKEINDHCKRIWLGLFIIAIILINAWILYDQNEKHPDKFRDPRIELNE